MNLNRLVIYSLLIIVLISVTRIPVLYGDELNQRVVKPIAHGIFDTNLNSRDAYFQFLVPYGVSDVRLTGSYKSYGGAIPGIDVLVVQSGSGNGSRNDSCPPFNFDRCYPKYLSENRIIGNINIELPSDKWYYLVFHNGGWLGELRQIEANIDLIYNTSSALELLRGNITE